MYDIVIKSPRSLSHLLMSSCWGVSTDRLTDKKTDRHTDRLITISHISTGGEIIVEMTFGLLTRVGPRNHVIHTPNEKGNFGGCSAHLKALVSLCCGVRSKRITQSAITARHAMRPFVEILLVYYVVLERSWCCRLQRAWSVHVTCRSANQRLLLWHQSRSSVFTRLSLMVREWNVVSFDPVKSIAAS